MLQVKQLKEEDEICFSAGWKAATLYYFLVRHKILPREAITTYCAPGSKYIGLAEPMPGIPFAGGSVGMGLSAGFGRALAKKILKEPGKVYVIESDGGLDAGLVWEAMLLAAHWRLDNLTLIIDDNKWCAMGRKEDVLSIKGMEKTFKSRAWEVVRVDGHDMMALAKAMKKPQKKPRCIFANTVKGKGVSFMEDDNTWHYWRVNRKAYRDALKEL